MTNPLDEAFGKLPNIVAVEGLTNGIVFRWVRTGMGFGEIAFSVKDDNRLHIDTEGMNDQFVLDVIAQALKEAEKQ